jgi:hypothetical protein
MCKNWSSSRSRRLHPRVAEPLDERNERASHKSTCPRESGFKLGKTQSTHKVFRKFSHGQIQITTIFSCLRRCIRDQSADILNQAPGLDILVLERITD